MRLSQGLKVRVERLEEDATLRGAAGIATARGGPHDLAEAAELQRRINELHQKGHQVVYVANLAGVRSIQGETG